MFTLTDEQRQVLDERGHAPTRVVNPSTGRQYVLLPVEVYDQIMLLADDGLDMKQVALLIDRNMREEDTDDPLLESYQKCPTRKIQDIPENKGRFTEESALPLLDRDRDLFLSLLDNPPAANEALKKAASRYQSGG